MRSTADSLSLYRPPDHLSTSVWRSWRSPRHVRSRRIRVESSREGSQGIQIDQTTKALQEGLDCLPSHPVFRRDSGGGIDTRPFYLESGSRIELASFRRTGFEIAMDLEIATGLGIAITDLTVPCCEGDKGYPCPAMQRETCP